MIDAGKAMTTINRLLAMFLLVAPAAWCQSPADKRAAAIDALAAGYVKAGKSPGLAVGVMHAGKIVLAKGYGLANMEQSTPVTPTTVFRIQSMTKQLTATGIMLLAERGMLRTDASLADFFPEFPRATEITIKQLLTHTAGLSSYDSKPEFRAFSAEPHSIPQLLQWIQPDPFAADPGTAWNYSNSGFLLLAGSLRRSRGSVTPYLCKRTSSINCGSTKPRLKMKRRSYRIARRDT
jgi:CubicO group peptidase (beta-lactamase class C family)